MAFRKIGEIVTDPTKFFVDEVFFRLKDTQKEQDWELKHGQLIRPNLQYFINKALKKAFYEVELEIDLDFPKEAKGLKETPEFLQVMEKYAPGFTSMHDLAMKTDDFKPMIDFLYPLSTVYEDDLKRKQTQKTESKGLFARIFS